MVDLAHLAVQLAVVGRPEGHAPERISHPHARLDERLRQVVVGGIERRQIGPERNPRSTGERRKREEIIGVLLLGIGEGVGEHEAALGIGVADLDRRAVAGADDIARAKGIAGDAVLGHRQEHTQGNGQLRRHDHIGKRERRCGTAHVLFHERHGIARLEVEPAGIETNALADDGHPEEPFAVA